MAVKDTDLKFIRNGVELVDGQINNLFGDATPGSGAEVRWVEFQNASSSLFGGSWSSGRVWLGVDASGATVQIGLADGTVRAGNFIYTSFPTPSFSTPLDYASGLVIPTLNAGQKVLLAVRRDTTGAGVAQPEVNRLVCLGNSPI